MKLVKIYLLWKQQVDRGWGVLLLTLDQLSYLKISSWLSHQKSPISYHFTPLLPWSTTSERSSCCVLVIWPLLVLDKPLFGGIFSKFGTKKGWKHFPGIHLWSWASFWVDDVISLTKRGFHSLGIENSQFSRPFHCSLGIISVHSLKAGGLVAIQMWGKNEGLCDINIRLSLGRRVRDKRLSLGLTVNCIFWPFPLL